VSKKRYGPKNGGQPAPVHEFEFVFLRDGVEEVHEFIARPRFGWKETTGAMSLIGLADGKTDHGELAGAFRYLDNIIRRSLANDDGTAEKWKANVVDGHFTDPGGDHVPVDLLPLVEAFDAGSSRRRWVHLMTVDDDVTVEQGQLMELFTDLMAVAADRPTERLVASSP
jgi:hypothetical protein